MILTSQELAVYGAGGHGTVVLSTALALGLKVRCVIDDRPELAGSLVLGVPVAHEQAVDFSEGPELVLGIGDNKIRELLSTRLSGVVRWRSLIHPKAWVCPSATIGEGSVVFAGAVVQSEAKVGKHVILNTGALVDHDCIIEDFCHLAPAATLCGTVKVGPRSLIGANAAVRQGVRVAADVTVGVGAAVVEDIRKQGTYVGVPARLLDIPAQPRSR